MFLWGGGGVQYGNWIINWGYSSGPILKESAECIGTSGCFLVLMIIDYRVVDIVVGGGLLKTLLS